MGNTHRFILKKYGTILGVLLAFLGFTLSSCKKMYGSPSVEYGTPSATFIVNGKVESSGTNQPIQNIRVIMQGDTTMTDAAGSYQIIDAHENPSRQKFPIQFQDIDGNLQGEYNNLDTVVEFKNPQFTNGETSKEFDIKLKPKK